MEVNKTSQTKVEEDKARFERYITKDPKGCWRWCGGRDIKDYGIFFFRGKTQFAHRVALLLYEKVKALTPGLQVRHSCRETSCVNPEHLKEGTREENAKDKVRDGTSLRGTRCHFSKLNWQKVYEIRKKSADGKKPKELAAEFQVSSCTIYSILKKKSWVE
jgi:hypothetical protein